MLDSTLGPIEVVNCVSCQLQVRDKTPSIQLDKSDSIQLYFDKGINETELITSKSSTINFLIPDPKDPEADFKEYHVPEQFKSTFKDGVLTTTAVEHE